MNVVLELLAECIGEPGESPGLHSDREIASLDMARRDEAVNSDHLVCLRCTGRANHWAVALL